MIKILDIEKIINFTITTFVISYLTGYKTDFSIFNRKFNEMKENYDLINNTVLLICVFIMSKTLAYNGIASRRSIDCK